MEIIIILISILFTLMFFLIIFLMVFIIIIESKLEKTIKLIQKNKLTNDEIIMQLKEIIGDEKNE